MSFLSKLWSTIRNPIRYVGRDLEGNKFYESRSPLDPQRTKRTVKYGDTDDIWKYVGGGKRLAIQWSAWLTHTRKDPPTLAELEADLRRQQRVLENAAMIEARDRIEAEERLRIRQEDTQKALEEASARAQGLLGRPGPETSDATAVHADLQESSSPKASNLGPPEAGSKPKVLPPKFLTPATPRKHKGSSKFELPLLDNSNDVSNQGLSNENAQASEVQSSDQLERTSTPPPMPTRPQSEAESWMPVARRRG